ncbi:hypothetical protein G7046_g7353 [Stylonectria norvegica]|nr:hypothetical protein G7046_g7353 [Stylonectria norvegica]
MSFQTFPIEGSSDETPYEDDQFSYCGPSASNMRHDNFHGFIDPNLEAGSFAPGYFQDQWGVRVPQMQRYLQEQASMSPFQTSQTHSMQSFAFATRQQAMVSSPSPGSRGRNESPFSLLDAQSPLTESDMCLDSTQGPSTPPDMAMMPSPFAAYDHWDGYPNQHSLAGIACMPLGGCVNLSEINPSRDGLADYNMDTTIDFSLDQSALRRTMSPASSPPTTENSTHSHILPVITYPDPEKMDKDNRTPVEIKLEYPHGDVDEDYKPSASRTPARRPKTAPRRVCKKKSPVKLTEESHLVRHTASSVTSPSSDNRRLLTSVASSPKACPECSNSFKDDTALQKHIKTQHTRQFICIFHFAGCEDTFAAKNEWKRHVMSQHIAHYYWLCKHDECGRTSQNGTQRSRTPTHGRPFRRKDLFSQHARRMHASPTTRRTGKSRSAAAEWEAQLKSMQDNAHRQRCELPTYMRCPAQDCAADFHGETAWDERMEHVARHLEGATEGNEPKVQFGGPNDDTLTEWAAHESVKAIRRNRAGKWEVCCPLKHAHADTGIVPGARGQVSHDEDAEGEDCY